MASMWLPGAKVITAGDDGGSMVGGAPRVVWHTTENDPTQSSATQLANYLNGTRNQVHLVWNPVSGEIVQMIPANRAGRGLMHPAGTGETNRYGQYCVQIEVVGQAVNPFTSGPCHNLGKIVDWLRSLGIKDQWPSGNPLPYPRSAGVNNGTRGHWADGGHYCHSNVPNNDHGDAGAIDPQKILGSTNTGGTTDMPLNDADKKWIHDILQYEIGAIVQSENSQFNLPGDIVTLRDLSDKLDALKAEVDALKK